MSKAFEEIAKEASQLSREQRLDLASMLLELNDATRRRRCKCRMGTGNSGAHSAVDENEAEGISFEAVMREAEDRLTS